MMCGMERFVDVPSVVMPRAASTGPGARRTRRRPAPLPGDARARKNYAATSPLTRASGKKKTVTARFIHNDRLIDALMAQAITAARARTVTA